MDDGEEQNDENVGGFMRKSDMTSKTEDDCFAQTRLRKMCASGEMCYSLPVASQVVYHLNAKLQKK